jgi:hypothetical protein
VRDDGLLTLECPGRASTYGRDKQAAAGGLSGQPGEEVGKKLIFVVICPSYEAAGMSAARH